MKSTDALRKLYDLNDIPASLLLYNKLQTTLLIELIISHLADIETYRINYMNGTIHKSHRLVNYVDSCLNLTFPVRPEKLELTRGTVTLRGIASMMLMIPGHEEKKITGRN